MNPELDPLSPSLPRAQTGGTLRQQLLKIILPTALLPLIIAGAVNWQITDRRSLQESQNRTWNQTLLASDLSDSIAEAHPTLEAQREELFMAMEHAILSPTTRVRIIDLDTQQVLITLNSKGIEPNAAFRDRAELEPKLTALTAELSAVKPSSSSKLKPGHQPSYISQRPYLEGLSIQPFVHEEGVYSLSTTFESAGQYYTLATAPNRNWVAVTTIATSEVHAAGLDALKLYLALTLLLAGCAAGIATMVARSLTQPLMTMTDVVKQAANGNLNIQAKVQGASETQVLAEGFNTLMNQMRQLLDQQNQETQRSQRLRDLSLRLSQEMDLDSVLQDTVATTRQILKTDRVLFFEFDATWIGTIRGESVGAGWISAQGMQIEDPCFAKGYTAQYQQGRISAVPDIYTANLTDCHVQQLAALSVRANLVAPVRVGGQLMGLLIAHECEGARDWTSSDIELFSQTASQVGMNLERINLVERSQRLAQEQAIQRENLQMGLVELLGNVEAASQGDLTVRAEVEGEVGTVGDFFNAIIGSLQSIVAQVKDSAEQVTLSVNENEVAIRQLASDAEQQAEELGSTLHSIDRMTQSIHTVAANAQEAAEVARSASSVAQDSSSVMDQAVATILMLRDTVTETSQKMQRLGESSKQISKVVELINQFALETNMLAINAGIEAARAGEEGRGFAVVAQEVGTLAAQSAGATKEIERIVSGIQRETKALVKAMQSGQAQVEEGTQLLEATKQSLGQIVDVSQRIDGLVETISTETIEQVNTSQSVAELMQQLSQVSERTSVASRQVSIALQATVAVTEQLQASVRTFKVADEG